MKLLEARAQQPARLVHDTPWVRIYHGRAEHWQPLENIGLVFTNPYGPLPPALYNTPMIIHQWTHRIDEARLWCGNTDLQLLGVWNDGREAFWTANIPREPAHAGLVALNSFVPEAPGWYPPEMVRRILEVYDPGRRPLTLWDGFMGRGTVGKVAVERFGMKYVGVEELDKHIRLAKEYLVNCAPLQP